MKDWNKLTTEQEDDLLEDALEKEREKKRIQNLIGKIIKHYNIRYKNYRIVKILDIRENEIDYVVIDSNMDKKGIEYTSMCLLGVNTSHNESNWRYKILTEDEVIMEML